MPPQLKSTTFYTERSSRYRNVGPGVKGRSELATILGGLFASYRVIEGNLAAGWICSQDLDSPISGQQVGLQANDTEIDTASTQLMDPLANHLATDGSDSRALIQQPVERDRQ